MINADDIRKSQQGQTENSASGDPKVKREDLQSEIYNNREQFTCAVYLNGETVGRDSFSDINGSGGYKCSSQTMMLQWVTMMRKE